MMEEDHSSANEELKAIAANKGIELPDSPDEEKMEHINQMQEKVAEEFDKAYITMMVMDHEKVIALFEDAEENAEDGDIKAFAAKTLPVLHEHLEQAEALSAQVNNQ